MRCNDPEHIDAPLLREIEALEADRYEPPLVMGGCGHDGKDLSLAAVYVVALGVAVLVLGAAAWYIGSR